MPDAPFAALRRTPLGPDAPGMPDLARAAPVAERAAPTALPSADMGDGWLPMRGRVPRFSRRRGIRRNPAPRRRQRGRAILADMPRDAAATRLPDARIAFGDPA